MDRRCIIRVGSSKPGHLGSYVHVNNQGVYIKNDLAKATAFTEEYANWLIHFVGLRNAYIILLPKIDVE